MSKLAPFALAAHTSKSMLEALATVTTAPRRSLPS